MKKKRIVKYKQDEVRVLVREIVAHAGSVPKLCKEIDSSPHTIYHFLHNYRKSLSEASALKLTNYCKKHRIAIKLHELLPHLNYLN